MRASACPEVGPPRNLVTSDVTHAGFALSWTPAPGNVERYQVKWKSAFSEENGEATVPGGVTDVVLDGLSPETLFQVSVVAKYEGGDSEALTGQETTDGTSFNTSDALTRAGQRSRGHVPSPSSLRRSESADGIRRDRTHHEGHVGRGARQGQPLQAEIRPRRGGEGGGPQGSRSRHLCGPEAPAARHHLQHRRPAHLQTRGRKSKARSRNDTYVGPWFSRLTTSTTDTHLLPPTDASEALGPTFPLVPRLRPDNERLDSGCALPCCYGDPEGVSEAIRDERFRSWCRENYGSDGDISTTAE